VKPVLHRRFDMGNWFKRHGFPVEQIEAAALRSAFEERERHMAAAAAASGPQHPLAPHPVPTILLPPYEHIPAPSAPRKPVLLLSDFDKTLTDFDAGEAEVVCSCWVVSCSCQAAAAREHVSLSQHHNCLEAVDTTIYCYHYITTVPSRRGTGH
jgi:hypothetical protein